MTRQTRHIPALLSLCLLGAAAAAGAGGPVQTPAGAQRLRQAAEAMGATRLTHLEYSGSGSSYTYDLDAAGEPVRNYARLRSYTEDVDYSGGGPAVEVTRRKGGDASSPTETQAIDPTSPWDAQLLLWMNPQVFLRHALEANDTRFGTVQELGIDYTSVTFQTPDGHELTGYLNPDNELRRIRAQVEDPALGAGILEASFTDYGDFGGIRFPSVVIHKQGSRLKLVVVVTEVMRQAAAL